MNGATMSRPPTRGDQRGAQIRRRSVRPRTEPTCARTEPASRACTQPTCPRAPATGSASRSPAPERRRAPGGLPAHCPDCLLHERTSTVPAFLPLMCALIANPRARAGIGREGRFRLGVRTRRIRAAEMAASSWPSELARPERRTAREDELSPPSRTGRATHRVKPCSCTTADGGGDAMKRPMSRDSANSTITIADEHQRRLGVITARQGQQPQPAWHRRIGQRTPPTSRH
jgi:hypothetical protein